MDETQFFEMVAARTGLDIRAKDREAVLRALSERARLAGSKNTADYLKLLARDTPESGAQWRALAPILTNGESYFWRDKGQFELLKTTILPQLLRARGGAVRIWSAGCSSGEEVYSLSMLLHELHESDASLAANRAVVVGTDINEEVLAHARRGVYGSWSFRGVSDELRARHFERAGDKWRVRPSLRARVSFEVLNLLAPQVREQMNDFDLILCRNVLIYLTPAAVEGAVQLFAAALNSGGSLLTGHAELTNRNLGGLVPQTFRESVIYRKTSATPNSATPNSATPNSVTPNSATPNAATRPQSKPLASARGREAKSASVRVAPAEITKSAQVVARTSEVSPADDNCARAHKLADAGAHEAALELCRAAIETDSCCVWAHELWAHIEIERGDAARAKTLLKKVLYLAPDDARGYLELAALYDAENDAPRAATMRAAAAKLDEAV